MRAISIDPSPWLLVRNDSFNTNWPWTCRVQIERLSLYSQGFVIDLQIVIQGQLKNKQVKNDKGGIRTHAPFDTRKLRKQDQVNLNRAP